MAKTVSILDFLPSLEPREQFKGGKLEKTQTEDSDDIQLHGQNDKAERKGVQRSSEWADRTLHAEED